MKSPAGKRKRLDDTAASPIASVQRPRAAPRRADDGVEESAAMKSTARNLADAYCDEDVPEEIFSNSENHSHDFRERHEVEDVDEDELDDAEPDSYIDDDFDPYLFIKNLPPLPREHRQRPCTLPRKTRNSHKCSLILDLDETLLHSSIAATEDSDLVLPVTCNGQEYQVYVKKRPYCEYFLKQVAQWFEVTVFTASQQVYAQKVLDVLDPTRKLIKYRQYRESCVEVEGNLLKDLTILGRDLARTIIVDNSIHAFAYQLENGIPITSWFDDESDEELRKLLPQLKKLSSVDDVRPYLRDKYKLHELVANAGTAASGGAYP